MSDSLRVQIVCEGITDFIVVEAAIEALLPGRSVVATLVQPETSAAFEGLGPNGGGWKGVRGWCQNDLPFLAVAEPPDALILHVDADAADDREVACAQPCPPASATTDRLRDFIREHWCGNEIPPQMVFCTPSKNTEAWVLQALYPSDPLVSAGIECRAKPERLLAAKPNAEKMVSRKESAYKKHPDRYRRRQSEISKRWPAVRKACSEADRFSKDLLAKVA